MLSGQSLLTLKAGSNARKISLPCDCSGKVSARILKLKLRPGHTDNLTSVGKAVVAPVIMYDDASYYYANYEAPSPKQQSSKKTVHKRKQSLLEQPSVNNVLRAPHLGLPISD